MLGISFIPPFSIGGINFRRANIISSLYEFGDEHRSDKEAVINAADKAFIKEMEAAELVNTEKEIISEETISEDIRSDKWEIGNGDTNGQNTDFITVNSTATGDLTREELNENHISGTTMEDSVVTIEDFTTGDSPSIKDFCALLGTETNNRVVRIGFLGDSFIEGDIIVADIREQLQSAYGGCGVGFVPFSTPLAQNRPTIKHTFTGWKNYNLIQKKSAPENIKEKFFISGTISTAASDASSEYETTSFRKNLNTVNSVRLLYTNTANSEITLTVNDTIERLFALDPDERVQQLQISGSGIKKLKAAVSDTEGFYGYGVVLEGSKGISVDNHSIRSNSGLPMFGTNASINKSIDRMLGYDMIVLQYGLNIMEADVTSYKNYGTQFRKMVNYIKNCFPNAVIVIMGIGDRSTMKNGEAVTMPGVKGMLTEQREAAMECEVAFWNTYNAMGGENSMSKFVSWGWAAKDYTHLSFSGGRKIATEFVKALEFAKQTLASQGSENEKIPALSDTPHMINARVENIDTFENNNYDNNPVQEITESKDINTTDSVLEVSVGYNIPTEEEMTDVTAPETGIDNNEVLPEELETTQNE